MKRDRPRILIISSLGPPPYLGGIENVISTTMDSWLASEVEFVVMDTYRPGKPGRSKLSKWSFGTLLFLRTIWNLLSKRPDAVHIHFCSGSDFWKHAICLRVAKLLGKKRIFHLHGGSFDQFHEAANEKTKRWIGRVFGWASVVIALSSEWKRFLEGFCDSDKILVLPNPIECSAFEPCHRDRGEDETRVVLLLGSLGKRKGHYDVLAALPRVLEEFPNTRVAFAGQDEDPGSTEKLRALADERGITAQVEFLGPVSGAAKTELLRRSTVMVLPSYGENMPISVMEGMAARIPVLASRVGAVPEVLAEGEAGILVEAGDVDAIAEGLLRLFRDPELSKRLAAAAHERVRSRWDTDVTLGQLRDLYFDGRELAQPSTA